MAIIFILGNLAGRALVSYAIVWIICWIVSGLNWRAAWRNSVRWYNLLVTAVLTVVGMGAALVRQGGVS